MGSMSIPNAASRQATRTLAAQCVAAVESDEAMPHGLHRVNMGTTMAEGFDVYDAEFVEDLVAKLAQEVVLQAEESEACRVGAAAMVARLQEESRGHKIECERWRDHSARVDQIEMDQRADLVDAHQQIERLTRERDEARAVGGIKDWAANVRLAAKFASIAPREDEFDSVLSLLNWCRANHDKDSAARVWLERVVEHAIDRLRRGE